MLGKILESSFSQVTLIEQPLPLYWVDKASEISTNEMDYFNYKVKPQILFFFCIFLFVLYHNLSVSLSLFLLHFSFTSLSEIQILVFNIRYPFVKLVQ